MPFNLPIIAVLVLAAGAASAQEDAPASVRVTGIVCHGTTKEALLEISSTTRKGLIHRPILRVGEKTEGVELRSIDERQGAVVLRVGQDETTFLVEGSVPQTESRTFNLRGADLEQVLDVYQRISRRTVIRRGNVPGAKVTLSGTAVLPEAEAVKELEKVLLTHGVATVPVGDKFACVVRDGEIAAVQDLPPMPEAPADRGEDFPPGMIKFGAADVRQVLEIYQELTARTVLASPRLQGRVTIRSQTPLNRAEVNWMVAAALQFSGTKMFPDGDKFVFAVPYESKDQRPPAFRSNASLVRPEDNRELPAGLLKFGEAELSQVLGVYAELCKRKVSAGDGPVPSRRIVIRSQTPLTTAESVYALDAVAALNGVQFVAVGETEIAARLLDSGRTARPAAPK